MPYEFFSFRICSDPFSDFREERIDSVGIGNKESVNVADHHTPLLLLLLLGRDLYRRRRGGVVERREMRSLMHGRGCRRRRLGIRHGRKRHPL
jgi:hypothetical protein